MDDVGKIFTLVALPAGADGHVWHLFVVRVADRDGVLARLKERGIGAGIHYPTPVHLQPAFESLGYRAGDLPEAERAASEVLCLPIFPQLREDEQSRVVEGLQDFYRA